MPIQKFNNGQWDSLEESAFTDRPPEAFYPQDYSKLFQTAAIGGGLFASGYIKTQNGNVWDNYISALQHVEEYSPGGILRTFQLSTFFSQFQSMPEQGIFIGSDLLQKNNNYRAYLGTLIGQAEGAPSTHNRLIAEGVTFKEGKLFWGQSDEVALPFASAFRESDQVISRLGAGYAQALGFNPKGIKREKFFSTLEPKEGIFNPSFNNEVLQITGGHTRRQALWRQMSAIGAESVNRFNRLLEAPFELEPFKTIFDSADDLLEKYTGKRFKFAVNQSTPIKQLGALSLKYGAGLGLLGMGYSTLDWAARELPLLNNTLFEEGLTAGIATIGIEANLAVSRLAELTGLHRYREAQEEVAPGSTSLQKLLAFPLAGALLGSAGAYAVKVPRMAKLQFEKGLSPAAARQHVVKQVATFSDDNALSRLGKQLTSSDGFYQRDDWIGKTLKTIARPGSNKKLHFKLLGELGPVKLAGLVGATAGLATIFPFLPGALIPSTRPEELERIYSGEQEVAIRKSRLWEMGRQPYEGEGIKYFRPHWYPRMIQRSKEKSIWGEDADDAPWSKFLRKEFTYELEAKHYEDRSYPISALPFQDIPLIGPLLANTLGRIIKPPQLMHEEEWMNAKGETLKPFGSFGAVSSATELGEKDPAQPISPFSPKSILSEQVYRMTEMMGLPGYTLTTIKEHLTGTPDLFDQHMRLESANRIAGFEREYWDKDLGGMMGTSEIFRRLYPHKQNQVPLYNPIKNQMPCLLPDTEVLLALGVCKKAEDIKIGDILISHKGEETTVEEIAKFPAKEIIHIKLYGDNLHTLDFSWNHPLLMNNLSFKHAVDVKENEYVAFPRRKYSIDNSTKYVDLAQYIEIESITDNNIYYGTQSNNFLENEIAESFHYKIESIPLELKQQYQKLYNICNYRKKTNKLISQKRFSRFWDIKDFYFLLGVYAAEGSAHRKTKSIKLAGHQNDKWENQLCEIFDKYHIKYSKQKAKKGIGQNIIITNPILLQILQKLCPGDAKTKLFALVVLARHIPESAIKALLKGLIDGDGYYCKTKENRIKCGLRSVSKDLGYQFRNLIIDTLGIAPAITVSFKPNLNLHITCSGLSANRLASYIGYDCFEYRPKQCNDKQYCDDNYIYLKVKSVEIEEKECYVIGHKVSKDHTFCVSTIATHNTWLPGSGERGPDLQHGDPYSRIQEGEIRLPGEGYAARFPELKDVDPEDYPLIHKYKILSDVAPYTEKFKMHAAMITSARKGSNWTEQNETIYQQVQAQIKAKKENKTFYQYQNLGPLGELGGGDRTYYRGSDDSSGLLEALNREKTSARESSSLWQRFFGGYWEAVSHNLETPLDYLTPISPGAKLVHMRSPIESYEKDVVFGTQNAFWDRPYENFLRPTANLIKMGAGLRDVPGHIKSQRNLEEYFDVLKYAKASRLANQAVLQNDYSSAEDYERTKNETLFGVNPFTQNYGSIYRALPKRDKDYFGAFTQAETVAERERILSLVPENEQALYKARWQQQLAADIVKAKTEGKLSPEQSQAGDQIVSSIEEASASEGMPTSKELLGEYLQTRAGGESYPDWYRRTKLLPKYSLPAADWIGWDPRVDLEDVKLKVVMNMGEDMHDYNLWADRARTLANKPYIDDIMIQPIINQENLSDSEKQARINNILLTAEANNQYENKMRTIVNIEQDRDFRSRN